MKFLNKIQREMGKKIGTKTTEIPYSTTIQATKIVPN